MQLDTLKLWLKLCGRIFKPSYIIWALNGYEMPAPQKVKAKVLFRHGFANGAWLETGTYLGETTKILAKYFPKSAITSLEPQEKLFKFAKKRLKRYKNVQVLNSTSESAIKKFLAKANGEVNFWLDGHFSGDVTFRGDQISPIMEEINAIEENLPRLSVCVFIDDVRDFKGTDITGYPKLDVLVNWAKSNNLKWFIELDIFIAKSNV